MSDNQQNAIATPATDSGNTMEILDANQFIIITRTKGGKADSYWVRPKEEYTLSKKNDVNAQNPFTRVYQLLVRPKTDRDRANDEEYQRRRTEGGQTGGYGRQGGGYGRGYGGATRTSQRGFY